MAAPRDDLEREFEGCRLTAYDDGTGTWTIGYGHTGPEVHPGLVWTQEQAEAALATDLAAVGAAVENLLARPAPQGQFDALCDFAFNEGVGALRGSTLLAKFNAGDFIGAARQFGEWDEAGSPLQVWQGLVRRRVAEVVRFCGLG